MFDNDIILLSKFFKLFFLISIPAKLKRKNNMDGLVSLVHSM